LGETKTDSRNPAWARPCGVTVKLLGDECQIRTLELLRFHSKLEKSSDEVEDVNDDRPIGPASKAIDLSASRLTL
jgi:hypothetical protein